MYGCTWAGSLFRLSPSPPRNQEPCPSSRVVRAWGRAFCDRGRGGICHTCRTWVRWAEYCFLQWPVSVRGRRIHYTHTCGLSPRRRDWRCDGGDKRNTVRRRSAGVARRGPSGMPRLCPRCPPAKRRGARGPVARLGRVAQDKPTAIGIILVTAIAVLKFLRWEFQPATREQVQLEEIVTEWLDKFRSRVFPNLPGNIPNHKNRVTLFKKVSMVWRMNPRRGYWFWPWGAYRCPTSGWLVVTHRSGHLTQNSKVAFLAANDGTTEGIVGLAYQAGAVRARGTIPDLNNEVYVKWLTGLWLLFLHKIRRQSDRSTDYVRLRGLVHSYAKETHTPPRSVWKRMKAGRTLPTNILGVRIETSSGKIWGVLVMDSCNTYVCIDSNDRRFQQALGVLKARLIQCGTLS